LLAEHILVTPPPPPHPNPWAAAGPRRVCYLGAYAGRREAALARDLALTWQERRAGLPPPTPLNFPLRTWAAALPSCGTLRGTPSTVILPDLANQGGCKVAARAALWSLLCSS
jgi:hypothetical protein